MIDTNTLQTTTWAKEPPNYTNTHTQLAAIHKYKYIYMQHRNTPKNNTNRKVHQSAWSAVCRFVADKGESYISPVAASLQGENIPLLFVLSQIQEQSRQDTKYKTQDRQNTKQTGDSERRG